MLKYFNRALPFTLCWLTGELLTFFKMHFIIGSWTAFFSASHSFTPLVGYHGGTKASLIYFSLRTLSKVGVSGKVSSLLVVYHLPTLLGSLYSSWTRPSQTNLLLRVLSSLISGVCIVLFGLHPVGYQALFYTSLWIFPLVMAFVKTEHFFLHALASTLTVHAVGSVLWLYTHTLTPEIWLALIPIAAIERVLFALGAVGLNMLYGELPYVLAMLESALPSTKRPIALLTRFKESIYE